MESETVAGRGTESQKTREKILLATLANVPFDGWTGKALLTGARDAGYETSTAALAFPGGMAEVAQYFSAFADQRMLAQLEKRGIERLRVRERVALAVRVRLQQNAKHKEAVRHLLSFLALPQNAALGLKCLYRTVDAIWYAAGDTATDFNFYTKRALLAGVYASTVLYWLNDASKGFEKTFAFLDRRIEDVMNMGKLGGRVKDLIDPFHLFRDRAGGR
ncbi:MAG: COQ9 family protein [Alphaproteobacteria bacterium]